MSDKKERKFNFVAERAMKDLTRSAATIDSMRNPSEASDINRPTDIRLLPLSNLRSAKFNSMFEVGDVTTLKEDIIRDGLLHNLVVRPTSDGMYEILSGHRRFEACQQLLQEGNEQFSKVSCSIKYIDDDNAAEVLLIEANLETRELGVMERANAAARLADLLGTEISGRTRDAVAEKMNISPRTAQSLLTIDKKMIPELKEIIDKRGVSLKDATSIAAMPEDAQRDVLVLLQSGGDQDDLKEQLKKLSDDKNDFEKRLNEANLEHKRQLGKLYKELESAKNVQTGDDVKRENRLFLLRGYVQGAEQNIMMIVGSIGDKAIKTDDIDASTIEKLKQCSDFLSKVCEKIGR
jgi:ParB family chromosome partitioning protein